MRATRLLPLLLLSGCALGDGEGFAVLEPTVRAGYVTPADRDAGQGYAQLASDFQVRLTQASVTLGDIDLLASSGGSSGATAFDPANPPEGYTLCHGGHCHRDDGALVPYDEVAAELSGGGVSTRTVASLPVEADLDLLAPEPRVLTCQPGCELPQTTVTKGRWTVTALRLTGAVRDSRATPRLQGERVFRLTQLTAPDGDAGEPVAVWNSALDVPSDRENKPRVLLGLQLEVTPALFDGVDWSAVVPAADGVLDLDAPANEAVRLALLTNVARLGPTAEVKREGR
ncbi:hypothetical protein DRW03_19060 [Corallococcus sp. H22C18031201]|nr:hypothetical protein DRW03_19060 [Corallococcus sp. H22C18031201]